MLNLKKVRGKVPTSDERHAMKLFASTKIQSGLKMIRLKANGSKRAKMKVVERMVTGVSTNRGVMLDLDQDWNGGRKSS